MKKLILFIFSITFVVGCADLDLQPTNMIAEDAVKKDPKLVEAFLTKIYANAVFEPNEMASIPQQNRLTDGVVGGEYTLMAPWQGGIQASANIPTSAGSHGLINRFHYGNIRSANEIIAILAEASFDPATVAAQTAEAKFLRAWMYLDMTKRYGGMPIEDTAKSIDADYDELMIPRSTLKQTYDFIISDLDAAIADLPGVALNGKATKWAAHALKSRAALYAARIAKYHPQSSNGLTSIPAGDANAYYQMSHASASAVIDGGKHPLHRGGGTYQKTFGEIFYQGTNSEHIFVEEYNLALGKTHTWSGYGMPDGFKAGWGSNMHPYIHSDARFEHKDGSPGNKSVSYTHLTLPTNREVWMHTGSVGGGNFAGRAGNPAPWLSPPRNRNRGGRLLQKRIDPGIELPPFGTDEMPYIVLRTGEMYLNGAEACLLYTSDAADE